MTFSTSPVVPPVAFEQIDFYDRGVRVTLWRCTDGSRTVYGPTRGAALAMLLNVRNTPQVITGEVLSAIQELVTYNWADEQRDQAEHPADHPGDHIFDKMVIIQEWLESFTQE